MTVRAPKQGGDGYASLLAELKERIRKDESVKKLFNKEISSKIVVTIRSISR